MALVLAPTLGKIFLTRVTSTPKAVAFQFKPTRSEIGPIGKWKQISFREYHEDCTNISIAMQELGVRKGDRVLAIAESRYECPLLDMAALGANAISISISPSITQDDLSQVLIQCEPSVVFLESAALLEKFLAAVSSAEVKLQPKAVVFIEPAAAAPSASPHAFLLTSLDELRKSGRVRGKKDRALIEKNLTQAKPHDLYSIAYTSGTTGSPKGAMISHDNLVSAIEDFVELFKGALSPEKETTLSTLPYSHALARFESLCGLAFGWRQSFPDDFSDPARCLLDVRPTLVFGSPLIFENVYSRIKSSIQMRNLVERGLVRRVLQAGHRFQSAARAGRRPKLGDSVEFLLAKRPLLRNIEKQLGGRLKFAICGGAHLKREVGEYIEILGVRILESYGLAEAGSLLTLNTPSQPKYGTVGRPLPEVSIKIANDGEILAKSRKIFQGYLGLTKDTGDSNVKDGWLKTGDIGYLDSSGYLHLTDRKKDMIVLSSGKLVSPLKIESLARACVYMAQMVVIGDRRDHLTALVTLEQEAVIQYATQHQILFSEFNDLTRHPKIQSLIQKAIDELNLGLAGFEAIQRFVILPHGFSVASGELTPNLRLRRRLILRKYRPQITALYEAKQSQSSPQP